MSAGLDCVHKLGGKASVELGVKQYINYKILQDRVVWY